MQPFLGEALTFYQERFQGVLKGLSECEAKGAGFRVLGSEVKGQQAPAAAVPSGAYRDVTVPKWGSPGFRILVWEEDSLERRPLETFGVTFR